MVTYTWLQSDSSLNLGFSWNPLIDDEVADRARDSELKIEYH